MLNKLYERLTLLKLPVWVAVLLSLVFVLLAVVVNGLGQNFCQPVTWFLSILIIVSVCFISYPMLSKFKKAKRIVLIISSLILWIYVFALIFSVNGIYNDGLLPIGLLFVVFLLLFPAIIFFIIGRRIKRQWNRTLKIQLAIFHSVVVMMLIITLFNYYAVAKRIQTANTIKQYEEIKNQSLISNYFVERIVGLHFIYHTRLCVYDGWRPPLLDPVISLGNTFFGDPISYSRNPILDDLEGRIKIYKALYPNNSVVQSCKCSQATPENYYIDMKKYD